VICQDSPEYPGLLKQTADPPFLLYRKGAKLNAADKFVATVGTRVPSPYGEKTAFDIAGQISICGGVIVSGLAFGIDAICHRAAVKNVKKTVAVLASPVACVTPSSHFNLAEKILQAGGTILSEYGGDMQSYKYRFLERNRIISGMCKATIVIEAAKKSGALITAAHANEQGRDVFALVGDITRPQAQGCLNLIENSKAFPIVSVQGLMAGLGFNIASNKYCGLDAFQLMIAEKIELSPCTTDELLMQPGFAPAELNAVLSVLEMKNLIRKRADHKWVPV
jgi:DNA processing protein